MLFFDSNSWFIHNELNNDIEKLEEEKEYYQNEIKKDNKEIKKLSTEEGLEKFGRETYNMKKEGEEIYLIEYEDSIAKQKKND
jgi:cell division protein FtsB